MGDHSLTPQTIIRRTATVLASELDDETVMMDADKGLYYGLDQVGSHIWAMVAQPVSVRQVCEQLVAVYDVPQEQCEQEVQQFLADLLRHDIIEVVDG